MAPTASWKEDRKRGEVKEARGENKKKAQIGIARG
jgi:hypothetical protein